MTTYGYKWFLHFLLIVFSYVLLLQILNFRRPSLIMVVLMKSVLSSLFLRKIVYNIK